MDKEMQTGLKARILAVLSDNSRPTLPEICHSLGIDESDAKEILASLELDGEVFRTRKGRYTFPSYVGLVVGTLQGNARGFAFLRPRDGSQDAYLAPDSLNGAMHGDQVLSSYKRMGF